MCAGVYYTSRLVLVYKYLLTVSQSRNYEKIGWGERGPCLAQLIRGGAKIILIIVQGFEPELIGCWFRVFHFQLITGIETRIQIFGY